MKHEYSAQIVWSQEDAAYVGAIGELPGCMSDGQTPEEALANLRIVAKEWIETAVQEGREVPKPATVEDLEKQAAQSQQQLKEFVQNAIQSAVQGILSELARASLQQSHGTHHWRGMVPVEGEFAGGSRR